MSSDLYPSQTRADFMGRTDLLEHLFPGYSGDISLPASNKEPSAHEVTFRMEHVSIKYGSRTILKELDWEVKNGEKWALFGSNGAGKSTLLSLIYADNPQSYANTLYLFDRKRGYTPMILPSFLLYLKFTPIPCFASLSHKSDQQLQWGKAALTAS